MNKELIRPLTSLRFYAAFLVFSIHVSMIPGLEWMHHQGAELQGRIGVSVFFVLSGFIMTYVYYGEDRYEPTRASAGRFIIARLTRIFPLHIITFLAALPLGLNSTTARVQVDALWQHFFLLQEWSPFGYPGESPNKLAWTLSCEFFFYLLTPPIFMLMLRAGRNKVIMLIGLFLAIAAANIVFYDHPVVYGDRAPFRWADYVLGIIAFLFFQRVQGRHRSWMNWLLPLGVLWFGGLMAVEYIRDQPTPGSLLLLPGSILVVLGVGFLRETKNWFLASDTMVRLGEASFALYIIQDVLLRYSRQVLIRLDFDVPWLLAVPWLILVFIALQWTATQTHLRIEVPLQDRGRKWLYRVLRLEKPKSAVAAK